MKMKKVSELFKFIQKNSLMYYCLEPKSCSNFFEHRNDIKSVLIRGRQVDMKALKVGKCVTNVRGTRATKIFR